MSMVSRSLEKMMLIAIGLSSAVLVGVPVLLYAIDSINAASEIELAQEFAEEIQNATARVDQGSADNFTAQVLVPKGVIVSAQANTLTVSYHRGGFQSAVWSRSYIHQLDLIAAPGSSGNYLIAIQMVSGIIEMVFSPL